MALFASPLETQRALTILLDLQSQDPNRLDGILNKYANPFTSWPLLAEPTRVFLNFFEAPARGVETGQNQTNINPRLEEMVTEFDREYAAAKGQRVNAKTAAEEFVKKLKENAKKSGVTLPETPAPTTSETGGAPCTPERVQEIIGAALQQPVPVEEKILFFHALTSFASEQPSRRVTELVPRAAAVTDATRVLVSPENVIPRDVLFSPRAAGVFGQLDAIVNHPESIPKDTFGDMTARWGENFVNSPWFTRLRMDANQMIADQKGAAKILGKVSSLFSDVSTTVLRGPIDQNVMAYMETYRLVATGGVHIHSPPQFGGVALGYGGRMGRAGMKRALPGILRGVGLPARSVGAGILSGGIMGALLRTNRGLFSLALTRSVTSVAGFFARLKNVQTKINGWLIAGAVVFLFILFILPLFGQSMIDTSIVTSLGGAGNNEPVLPPDFGPINGSITDCITSHAITVDGVQTLTLSADRASRFQNISQKYPQLGCYSKVLNCPTTKINVTAFAVQSGGLGGFAPSGMPGNIIFYPAFFSYNDYYFAYLIAHEMMHEVEWLHSNIYDAFMHGTTDGSFQKGYCGPLGTYKAGDENSYETMSEAAAFYLVGNPVLQQKCLPAYNFMKTLFSACQK